MADKGDGGGFAAILRRQLGAFPQQGLVDKMDPVKKSQRKNSSFHHYF